MSKAEFYPKMTHEEYLAHPAISRSMLMTLNKSPRHYWHEYLSGESEPLDTKPLQIGTALHTLVIEPHRFADLIAVTPDGMKRASKSQINAKNPSEATQELLQWWSDFEERNEGKIIISESELGDIKKMADAVGESEFLGKRGHMEAAIIWTDEETGLQLKFRGDWISSDFRHLQDIKTTANASPKSFQRSIVDYGYDVQAFMGYEAVRALGHEPESFRFTCVEKKAPFCKGLYNANDAVLYSGQMRFNRLLTQLADCLESDTWPSYTPDYQDVGMPTWHMYDIEETEEEIEV